MYDLGRRELTGHKSGGRGLRSGRRGYENVVNEGERVRRQWVRGSPFEAPCVPVAPWNVRGWLATASHCSLVGGAALAAAATPSYPHCNGLHSAVSMMDACVLQTAGVFLALKVFLCPAPASSLHQAFRNTRGGECTTPRSTYRNVTCKFRQIVCVLRRARIGRASGTAD
ncbi:hypothetical protein O3P69_003391 [Scylla paramamosain]|uniref:Uncharacterized protein n=1 Tax=Scylla paramamosain TaxID=85552 RepID=A0AAW0UJT2_SCYPA